MHTIDMINLLNPHFWPYFLYSAFVVALAFYVRATIGFGSGLISVSLLSLMFPIKEVVPVVLILDLAGSILLGAYDFEHIRFKELTWLFPGSIIGLIIGTFILANTDAQNITRFLGVFIISYVIYAVSFKPEKLPIIRKFWAFPLGMLAGIIGSLYGGGGPPLVAYLQLRRIEKRSFRATFQIIALLDNILRVFTYLSVGLLNLKLFEISLSLIPFAGLGLFGGNKLHMKISSETFMRLTLMFLFLIGIKYLI
ncbi:MAG: sulfite exporter TauE/SafE family protein [Hydrogenobaculum sp.]